MGVSAKILIVDDERTLAGAIAYNLQKEGYTTVEAYDGEQGLRLAQEEKPQLIILDLMLPRLSGWDVCRALRQDRNYQMDVPILMLTARGEESDKVVGLEMGADDYLVKPFGMRELAARVKVLLRRYENTTSERGSEGVLRIGKVTLDADRHEVRVQEGGNWREVKVSLKEFELLRALMSNAGRAMPRAFLLEKVWGTEFFGDERTLDVHIRWLREKIEDTPAQPTHILTVRGVGYKFRE